MRRLQDHSDVVVLDCTYKTNKYNIPLLNVIVMTGMNTVLPVAQCWLPGETEPDYTWALERVRQIFTADKVRLPRVIITDRDLACMNAVDAVFPEVPALVCRWHMDRNVLARVQQVLGQKLNETRGPFDPKYTNTEATATFMNNFYEAVDSQTEDEFKHRAAQLNKLCPVLGDYLERTWWKYKSRIVCAWTNQYQHFGYVDTSTVEGTHAKIKNWLKKSKGDLLTVFQKLLPWWKGHAAAVRFEVTRNETSVPYPLQHVRYSAVVRMVSIWALNKTDLLWNEAAKMVRSGIRPGVCSGTYRYIHGRPCVHDLYAIEETSGIDKRRPEHFNYHWWLRLQPELQPLRILEPQTIQKKRRLISSSSVHATGHGLNSTRREPNLSKRVDCNNSASAPMVPVCLPSLKQCLERQNDVISDHYVSTEVPPRTWGYAGIQP